MSIKNGLFLSSENVWLFILAFFWKRANTYRYRCYKDGRFFIPIFFSKHAHTHRYEFCKVAYLSHLKMSEFLFLRFSENTHTRTDIDVIKMADFIIRVFSKHAHMHRYEFYKVAYLFRLKMSELLSLLFSENTHTRTDIDVIKMADFSSAVSFQNTHTRKDLQIWILQNGWFFHLKMSEYLSLLFSETRTRAQIRILKNGWFLSSENVWVFILAFFWKCAHTHRYQCYKDGRFFVRIFCQNTHTRTDINFTQWMISFFISKCPNLFFSSYTYTRTDVDVINMADFSFVFLVKTRTHAQI